MPKMNVKTGDKVQVLSGKDKGAQGEVLRAYPREGKVKVEGVAMVKKAQRPTQENQNGGFVDKEAKISEVQELMNRHKIHSVLVADKDRHLLGIVDRYACVL